MLVISNKAFAKLKKDDRELVREILTRTFETIDRRNRKDSAQALTVLQRQGIDLVQPPYDDLERWRQTVETAVQRFERQGFFSNAVIARVRRLIAEYRRGRR
jgi:TRAP-type C4-dicarboxylate transport system substrate-binding protein